MNIHNHLIPLSAIIGISPLVYDISRTALERNVKARYTVYTKIYPITISSMDIQMGEFDNKAEAKKALEKFQKEYDAIRKKIEATIPDGE